MKIWAEEQNASLYAFYRELVGWLHPSHVEERPSLYHPYPDGPDSVLASLLGPDDSLLPRLFQVVAFKDGAHVLAFIHPFKGNIGAV